MPSVTPAVIMMFSTVAGPAEIVSVFLIVPRLDTDCSNGNANGVDTARYTHYGLQRPPYNGQFEDSVLF